MALNIHYCQHTFSSQQTILWHTWMYNIVKYFIAILFNRQYCENTSVLNRQYCGSHGYNTVKYFIAIYCTHQTLLSAYVSSHQTILWLSCVQYSKIFYSNMVVNRHYCQHTFSSQQTILWLSWVQYIVKIFHSNMILNRH